MSDIVEHARAHSPLKPSYPGSRGRYGGTHHRSRYYRRPYRSPYYRSPYHRSQYYGQQPVYVIQEQPTYNVPVSHWWYPNSWYPPSWFHEGFQVERNMNCSILSILCLLILVGYYSKK